jgi:hypothetical protein
MCNCINIEMGSYDNQEELLYPFKTERYPEPFTKLIGVDRCISKEVVSLWESGIETVESCCGHNVAHGYISVPDSFINRMIVLGYEQLNKEYEFKPKST